MKYLITFSYDGSKFFGYQKQLNFASVQEKIENALTKINSNKKVLISASGRTDAGVHAINQKAHFIMENKIEKEKLKNSLNKMVKPHIFIKNIEEVNDLFHARFNVVKKKYTYKINVGEFNPIEYDYIYQLNKKLDICSMLEGIKYFEGEHDFTSFTKKNDEVENFVREIYNTNIEQYDNIIEISFVGNGFLRYMVRNMVGSLIEIGLGKKNPKEIIEIIEKKDRTKSGITAPSNGLYLMDVYYE
ncbi:MAG: tRNA pseudouridine(38-40) synthase TruA [Bacilli bacterium]